MDLKENYVLNDLSYDNVPLRIIPQAVEKIDEEELKKSVEKNRKMIESMRKEENYKRIMAM